MPDQCDSHAATGGRCELDAGHDGKHQATGYPADAAPYTYYWRDGDAWQLVDRESRKPLGT